MLARYKRGGLAVFQWPGERSQHRWEAAQLMQQRLHAVARNRIPTLVVPTGAGLPLAEVEKWTKRHAADVVVSPSPEFRRVLLESGWSIPRRVS